MTFPFTWMTFPFTWKGNYCSETGKVESQSHESMVLTPVCVSPPQVTSSLTPQTLPSFSFLGEFKITSPLILIPNNHHHCIHMSTVERVTFN